MRLAGITPESFVDGPGLRFVLFAQGCRHRCPHCHNPESWDFSGGSGEEYSVKQIVRLLKRANKSKMLRGVTFSGGEPFLQAGEFANVASAAHELGFDIVTYTGFTYEELLLSEECEVSRLLGASDILIDGPYVHELRDIGIPFRGSRNQRVIDMESTRKAGRVALFSLGSGIFNRKI